MCVHRFINGLPVSSHSERGRDKGRETRRGKTECFVLRLSGNKRQMGAVTSESDRIEREKESNRKRIKGIRRERHLVMEK